MIIFNCHISICSHINMDNVNMKQGYLKLSLSCLVLLISRQLVLWFILVTNGNWAVLERIQLSHWRTVDKVSSNTCTYWSNAVSWFTKQIQADQLPLTLFTKFASVKLRLCSALQISTFLALGFVWLFFYKGNKMLVSLFLILCKLSIFPV